MSLVSPCHNIVRLTDDCCDFYSIPCRCLTGRINLSNNMIAGTIPEFADLPDQVTELFALNVPLSPEQFLNISSLLDIGRNTCESFSRQTVRLCAFAAHRDSLRSLFIFADSLDFSNNLLTGEFPFSLGVLTTLSKSPFEGLSLHCIELRCQAFAPSSTLFLRRLTLLTTVLRRPVSTCNFRGASNG